MKKILIALCLIAHFTHAQSIRKVRIGNQTWMSKNLDTDRFRNGDPIPEARTDEEWKRADENKQPAWCYFGNDPVNGKKHGRLYNWYAVSDSRGLAPEGWHVPSDAEWNILADFLGGVVQAGDKMKSKSCWNEKGNGTNESRFSGFPTGYRWPNGDFVESGNSCNFWSTTEVSTEAARSSGLIFNFGLLYQDGLYKAHGFSVRCIKD